MKQIGFLIAVSLGMSAGAAAVPLVYPHTLPLAQAYCLPDPAFAPAGWVKYAGGCAYVYVYEEGRACRRIVGAAVCPDGTVQLCFGVSPGQWLLSGEALADGERVRITVDS